jgi:NAD(P)-dependent dehydrogenase (short-subunit alcohol dehydrogenase family)
MRYSRSYNSLTLSALRLALFHMKRNKPQFSDGARGSIVLVTSTSGYFGGTGAAAYIASKHGATGLLRASQNAATKIGVRVNAIAPNFTSTQLTKNFSKEWYEAGMTYNTPETVARVIVGLSADASQHGACFMVCTPICS